MINLTKNNYANQVTEVINNIRQGVVDSGNMTDDLNKNLKTLEKSIIKKVQQMKSQKEVNDFLIVTFLPLMTAGVKNMILNS